MGNQPPVGAARRTKRDVMLLALILCFCLLLSYFTREKPPREAETNEAPQTEMAQPSPTVEPPANVAARPPKRRKKRRATRQPVRESMDAGRGTLPEWRNDE